MFLKVLNRNKVPLPPCDRLVRTGQQTPEEQKGSTMKRSLMNILCCPDCKGKLTLHVESENEDEVEEGSLRCQACARNFPIREGIPNLLIEEG